MTGVGGNKKGRPAELVLGVEIGAFADQKLRDLGRVFTGRTVKRCAVERVSFIDVSSVVEQGLGGVEFSKKGSIVDRAGSQPNRESEAEKNRRVKIQKPSHKQRVIVGRQ